jgi:uncharacterized protein
MKRPARPQATLCLFARVPHRGRVKRRLAESLGDAAALAAHCHLVEDSLERLAGLACARCEMWLDAAPDATCRDWSRHYGVPLRRQEGGHLGARMNHALTESLAGARFALVVGSDCPPVDGACVAAALAALADHDAVIAPAQDGGYGLIGLARPAPMLFEGIAWGSGRVLAQTLDAAAAAAIRLALLPEIWDVDTAADWERFQRSRQAG